MDDISITPVKFHVDVPDENVGFVEVEAMTVYNLDGDLIFVNTENVPIDMISAGHWRRCRICPSGS